MFGLLRFILALNVVAFHILSIPVIGPLAVYSFFILSGFLMTTIMHKTYGYSVVGFKKYALNRFLRLYPLYWALMLLTLLCFALTGIEFINSFHTKMDYPGTWSEALANIFMVYPYEYPVEYDPRLAPATWALTIELFFYLIIGLGASKSKTSTVVWFLLSLGYLAYANIVKDELGLRYGNLFSASLPFSMGALIYHYRDVVRSSLLSVIFERKWPLTIFFYANVFLTAGGMMLFKEQAWKFQFVGTILNLPLSALLIIQLMDRNIQFCSPKMDKLLGDLSYPVYIFHWTGAAFASWLLFGETQKGITTNGLITFSAGLLITIVISLAVNKYINEIIEKVREKIKRN